jgi:hypothetical protein
VGAAVMANHATVAGQYANVNFLNDEGTARVRAAYGPNYERLAALKTKYDPDNMFHLERFAS